MKRNYSTTSEQICYVCPVACAHAQKQFVTERKKPSTVEWRVGAW